MLRLRELRLEKGLSVPELSRRSGVSRRTIEDIEARRRLPHLHGPPVVRRYGNFSGRRFSQ